MSFLNQTKINNNYYRYFYLIYLYLHQFHQMLKYLKYHLPFYCIIMSFQPFFQLIFKQIILDFLLLQHLLRKFRQIKIILIFLNFLDLPRIILLLVNLFYYTIKFLVRAHHQYLEKLNHCKHLTIIIYLQKQNHLTNLQP